MGFYLATVRNSEFLVGCKGRTVYTSGNRPNWWPKDVAFASMTGIIIVTSTHVCAEFVAW